MLLRPRPLLRAGMFGGAVFMGQRSQIRAAERARAAAAPATPAPAPAPVDVVSRLRELKGLLDSGALTPEEFDTAKQRLLSTT
jgi:Short C-terminal domain